MEEERLILQLIKINKNLKKLRKQLRSRPDIYERDFNPDDWCLVEYVFKALPIGKSSLYRYRKQGLIRWKKRGGITRYYIPDVEKLKVKCMK